MIHAWAWPPRALDSAEYINTCLRMTGCHGVILWPQQWRHAHALMMNGVSVVGYVPHAGFLKRSALDLIDAHDLEGVIVGDEPNAKGVTVREYLSSFREAQEILQGAGFPGWYQLAGLAGKGGLFNKYNTQLDTAWLDAFIMAARDTDARVGLNMFWVSANDTLVAARERFRRAEHRPLLSFTSGFENYGWWREPVSTAYREWLGYSWLFGDSARGYALRAVWALHTSSVPVANQSANQWGLVRNDGDGPVLTRTGQLMRRYNAI